MLEQKKNPLVRRKTFCVFVFARLVRYPLFREKGPFFCHILIKMFSNAFQLTLNCHFQHNLIFFTPNCPYSILECLHVLAVRGLLLGQGIFAFETSFKDIKLNSHQNLTLNQHCSAKHC